MADLTTFLRELQDNGTFASIRDNTAVQFGPPAQQYLGATLLPERNVANNIYKERGIRFRTVVANDGTRYSPVQIKSPGRLVGEFTVELGNSDIGLELDSSEYDAVLDYLQNGGNINAAAALMNMADAAIGGLAMLNERQRWQAIVDAEVVRSGDNGYTETVAYSDPASHRAAAGDWTDITYDPFDDIMTAVDLLASKGYRVARIIASTPVLNILSANPLIKERWGSNIRVVGSNTYVGRLDNATLNAGLGQNGLPAIEIYDALWFDQVTSGRMMADDVMVMVGTTGQGQTVDTVNGDLFLPNTVGYTAIGRAVGQQAPGRVLQVESQTTKPPTVRFEAWQSSLPVIADPESLVVINAIGA